MRALNEKICREGIYLGDGILKVDSFLNHQVDSALMDCCGRELADSFRPYGPQLILTAEISGIAPALLAGLHLGIPVVYARKHRPITMAHDVYFATAPSHTKGGNVSLLVSSEFLVTGQRILVIDDFLASGATILALTRLVKAAGATLVGIGVVIEKTFEEGRRLLTPLGVPIVALAKVISMAEGKIILEDS